MRALSTRFVNWWRFAEAVVGVGGFALIGAAVAVYALQLAGVTP